MCTNNCEFSLVGWYHEHNAPTDDWILAVVFLNCLSFLKSLFIIRKLCYPSYSEKFSEVIANAHAFGGSENANIT